MLKAKIQQDLEKAIRARDSEQANVLRFLLAKLHEREIEKRSTGQSSALTQEDEEGVLQREVKKRKEAVELFKKGGRSDLVEKEEKELAYILGYLPEPLGEGDIGKIVDELKRHGFTEFSELMREAMKAVKGRADGITVSRIVKQKLEAG